MNKELERALKIELASCESRIKHIRGLLFNGESTAEIDPLVKPKGLRRAGVKAHPPKSKSGRPGAQPGLLSSAILGVLKTATHPLDAQQVYGHLVASSYDFKKYRYPLKAVANTMALYTKHMPGVNFNKSNQTYFLALSPMPETKGVE